MIEKLKRLLDGNGVSLGDQEKIILGFKNIPLPQRMLIYSALLGHPKLISVFVSLMNKKIDLKNQPSEDGVNSIIKEEQNLLEDAFKAMGK